MGRYIRRINIIILATLLLAGVGWGDGPALAQGEPRTMVLQNGAEIQGGTYTGCEDTLIRGSNPDSNYGSGGSLSIGRANLRALIRFDVSMLPQDTNVISATLSLYCSGIDGATPGTIGLFQMLRADWIEDKATWNTYDGVNDWTSPGAEGDYEATVIDSWNPSPGSWGEFDITQIVGGYVSGNNDPERGFFLKPITTSWDHTYMVSSENSDLSLRPKLTITYESNAPTANAGSDQEMGKNAQVTLDGTGSTDPNENQKALIYSWHFLSKPWDSNLTDNDIFPNNDTGTNGADMPVFTVDALGDYEIELSVTNSLGLTAKDIVKISSFHVKAEHPRIWLTDERLQVLEACRQANTPEWQALISGANRTDRPDISTIAAALVYQVTGDITYAQKVIDQMLERAANPDAGKEYDPSKYYTPPLYIGFDWVYNQLSETDKATIINAINEVNDWILTNNFTSGLFHSPTNVYGQRAVANIGLSGYATYGDNPRARQWIDEAMWQFTTISAPYLDGLSASGGGAWPHSAAYGSSFECLLYYIEGVESATGEDLLGLVRNFAEAKIYYLIHSTYPKGDGMHMFGETWKPGPDASDWRLMLWLTEAFSGTQAGEYAQWWLKNHPSLYNSALYHSPAEVFVFYDPQATEKAPNGLPLFRHEPYVDHVYTRSDWTEDATWLSFECGPANVDHLHYDNNQFTIFKHSRLAIETATYEPGGTAYHNTLLIGSESQISTAEDAGKIISLEDKGDYTYVQGDATNSYNTSQKYVVDKFTRQVVFLRPDYIIVFDRVKTPQPVINTWRVHSATEPQVTGDTAIITNGQGRLFSKTLLPEGANITAGESMYGDTRIAWKLDVENSSPQDFVTFLHVLQATDVTTPQMTPAQLVDEGNYYGVIIDDPALTYNKVLFSKTQAGDYQVTSTTITPLKGDVNGDRLVNVVDVQLAVNQFLGVQPQTQEADLNGDGLVNVIDVQLVVNIILGG